MAGRAGRAGIDTAGEVVVIAQTAGMVPELLQLMCSETQPIESCLTVEKRGMKRAMLEVGGRSRTVFGRCLAAQQCVASPGCRTVIVPLVTGWLVGCVSGPVRRAAALPVLSACCALQQGCLLVLILVRAGFSTPRVPQHHGDLPDGQPCARKGYLASSLPSLNVLWRS